MSPSKFVMFFIRHANFSDLKRSVHLIFSQIILKCLEGMKNRTIIFSKFLKIFMKSSQNLLKLFKILNHIPKICPYFSLNSTKLLLNICLSTFYKICNSNFQFCQNLLIKLICSWISPEYSSCFTTTLPKFSSKFPKNFFEFYWKFTRKFTQYSLKSPKISPNIFFKVPLPSIYSKTLKFSWNFRKIFLKLTLGFPPYS